MGANGTSGFVGSGWFADLGKVRRGVMRWVRYGSLVAREVRLLMAGAWLDDGEVEFKFWRVRWRRRIRKRTGM